MPPAPPTLKQRLAALSLSPSAPSSPTRSNGSSSRSSFTSPKTKPTKRMSLMSFSTSWGKRPMSQPQDDTAYDSDFTRDEEQSAKDRVQEVMRKMIFQAGVDFETRPMVVINASALPDPREVSYDLLLARILSYLNLYVESDYTVVFFAAGGRHSPGWNWVWKAYRSLSRKYRKNLKRLFIVHSTFFSKMLFSLAGAIVSPKFFRKITYIQTLSELAFHVPLTQIDIPPAVYQENLKHEKQITLPCPTRSDIFGVPLEELMGYDGEKGAIPRVVKDSIQFLRETGMEEEGLFRRSPNSVLLRQAQEAYDRGHTVSLETFGDPHLAAVLLKKFLRDLPEPIFPENLYPVIRRCPAPTSDLSDFSSITYIQETLLPELPHCVYILLSNILRLMHEVSLRAASNRMDAHNLAIVLCPNLISGTNPARDVMMCSIPGGANLYNSAVGGPSPPEGKTTLGMVIRLCILRYFEIFDEIRDRSEAVPPPGQEQSLSISASTSSSSSVAGIYPGRRGQEDDEEIDDAMLVMPLGPSSSEGQSNVIQSSTPSAWNSGTSQLPYKSRSKKSGGGVRSMHTTIGRNGNAVGNEYAYGSMSVSKARSLISIETSNGTVGRKGTISVGRGTGRKSSGAGVEAISVTASGFFTPPTSAPPVPVIPVNVEGKGTLEGGTATVSRELSEVSE